MTIDRDSTTSQDVDFPTGPAVGEAFPDFTLPNQRGEQLSLHVARRGRRALVTFFRSARW